MSTKLATTGCFRNGTCSKNDSINEHKRSIFGTNRTNPFYYQKFGLNETIVYRNGLPNAETPVSTSDNKRIYYNTIGVLDFVLNTSHGISLANYDNHYIMAFDIMFFQDASHDSIHLELINCTTSVELKFDAGVGNNVELLFMGERASTIHVRSDRKVTKTLLLFRLDMDNLQKMELINRCKHLNYQFKRIFPADFPCSSVSKNDNTFMIRNASSSDQPGIYWLLLAQAEGQIFFADPLGKRFYDYPLVYKNMRRTIHERNQLLMKN